MFAYDPERNEDTRTKTSKLEAFQCASTQRFSAESFKKRLCLLLWASLFAIGVSFGTETLLFASDCGEGGTDVSGIITAETVWTLAQSPYCLTQTVTLSAGARLTIQPGVQVHYAYAPQRTLSAVPSLVIQGELIARGTETQMIQFTSARAQPKPGDWGSLEFTGTAKEALFDKAGVYLSGSILEYVLIEYGGALQAAVHAEKSPYFAHGVLRNNLNGAVHLEASGSITQQVFENNTNAEKGGALAFIPSVDVEQGTSILTITSSSFSQNHSDQKGGAVYASSGKVVIAQSAFEGNDALTSGGALYSTFHLTVSDSTFTQNKALSGAGIYGLEGPVSVVRSTFTQNHSTQGASAIESAGLSLEEVLIQWNWGPTAVHLFQGDNAITKSTLIFNFPDPESAQGSYGITTEVLSSTLLRLSGSNIYGHSLYDISNGSEQALQAFDNYWGTLDSALIALHLYDKQESASKGDVDYGASSETFLKAPASEAPGALTGEVPPGEIGTALKPKLALAGPAWHLVHPGDLTDLDTLLNNQLQIESIWSWTGTLWDVKFRKPPENNPYGALIRLESGKGYWLKTTGTVFLAPEVPQLFEDLKAYPLLQPSGWILLGATQTITELSTFFSSLSSQGTVWVWQDQQWSVYTRGDSTQQNQFNVPFEASVKFLKKIDQGQGFWVNLGVP
ncbi:hypothetical protein WDW89_16605 [Deltaproteobacteria bacterium TL4]